MYDKIHDNVRRHPFLAAAFVNALLFGLVYGRYTPCFETNDDVGMMLSAAGVSAYPVPCPYLLFTNVILGWALKRLYLLAAGIPWYALYLVLTLFLAQTAILGMALTRGRLRLRLALYLAYFAFPGAYLLLTLQYTSAATLATLAGLALLVFGRGEDAGGVRPSAPRGLAAVGLIVLGCMIRRESFLLAVILFAPLAGLTLLRGPLLRRGPAYLWLGAALALSFAAVRFDRYAYDRDPGWAYFKTFHPLRWKIQDGGALGHGAQAAPAVAKAGWSMNDYEMLCSWFFLDERVYNPETFARALSAAPVVHEHISLAETRAVVTDILATNVVTQCLLLAALGLCVFGLDRRRALDALAALATVALLIPFMIYVQKAPPPRVFVPMFVFLTWLALFAWDAPAAPVEARPRRGRRVWGAAAALVLVLLLVQARRTVIVYGRESARNATGNASLCATVRALQPTDDELYVAWGSAFPWRQLMPFADLGFARHFHTFELGCGQQTPIAREMLRRFDVDNLYTALVNQPKVRLLCHGAGEVAMYRTYLHEHYGLDATPIPVFKCKSFSVYRFGRE